MALYTTESKERVRDAVDMVALVSARTELRRAGANRYTGLCPFHDERTPSFGINPAEKVYHCFGCQASGDAFTFVMETEGVDFKGALELLAERFGVALEVADEDPQAAERRRRRERLLELLERTARFYERQLWESREAARARDYLAGRGLQEEALRAFRVGYAPSAWDTVLSASRRAGYGARELYDAGLAQRNERTGRVYDRFRAQVTFPLADGRGRVRGFAGRTLGGEGDRRPKYVNSPESPPGVDLFHKRRQLFGADRARAAAAREGRVIVAEGYTDVIALHQAGVPNAVAVMGTSLTEEQVGELARLAPVAVLALDADSAGQAAMLRAARVAAGRRLELRVAALAEGQDPADIVARAGGDEIRRLLDESVPFVRFRVQRALDCGDLSDAEGKDRVLAELRGVFATIAPSVQRDELLRAVADRMDLSMDLVASLVEQAPSASAHAGGTAPGRPAPPRSAASGRRPRAAALDGRERAERAFLALCIALPELGGPALAELDLDAELSTRGLRRAAAHLRDHLSAPTAGLPDDDAELAALVRALAVAAAGRDDVSPAGFAAERAQLELHRIERDIDRARARGEPLTELAARRTEVKARIDRAMERVMSERG